MLDLLLALHKKVVSLLLTQTPIKIQENLKFYPYFDNCLGALDSSHIPTHSPESRVASFQNQKGTLSQNILGVCTVDIKFAFVLAG